jgi:hypothetical protein
MLKNSAKCLLLAFMAITAGCAGSTGPELGQVSGTVTIDGTPAADIKVKFNPVAGGRASTGLTDSSGKYTLVYSPDSTGAVLGQHRVTIESETVPSDDNLDLSAPKSTIPAAYLTMTKDVQVDSGKSTIDFVYP